MIWVIIIILAVIVFWGISVYNFFVSSKARIKAAIQEIGNQLKRQADLIPNLEESAKSYLKHEKKIYADLTEARKAVAAAVKSQDPQEMADAGSKLAAVLPNIKVIVESNPELKASEVVSKLMDELRDTADKIMYARRLVIDLTADFNVRRATFPSNIVASIFGMEEMKGMIMEDKEADEVREVSSEDTKTPKVNLD